MCQYLFCPLMVAAFLMSGCVFDHGFRVSIRPRSSITTECFVRALEKHIPDLRFEDERKSGSKIYLNFRMSEQFKDKLGDLGIRGVEKGVGKLDSWFRFNGEKLEEIMFAFLYDEKLNQMSQADMRRVGAFARPYAAAIKNIPLTLQQECGLKFGRKDVDVRCQGVLCE